MKFPRSEAVAMSVGIPESPVKKKSLFGSVSYLVSETGKGYPKVATPERRYP
jgi:hypothetical protein